MPGAETKPTMKFFARLFHAHKWRTVETHAGHRVITCVSAITGIKMETRHNAVFTIEKCDACGEERGWSDIGKLRTRFSVAWIRGQTQEQSDLTSRPSVPTVTP